MIKSVSLYTLEVYDCEKALEDIQNQLKEKLVLQKNTAGILHCGYDFIESGVVSHLCRVLDFPIVGTTVTGQAVNGAANSFMLTMLVLTSDDVEFFAGHSVGHKEDFFGAMERNFPSLDTVSSLPLKMAFVFPPLTESNGGDNYIDSFERLCGSIPIFGTMAVEEAIMTYTQTETICNGESFSEEVTYLLAFGNINPRFFVTNVPKKSNLLKVGTITRSEGNVVCEIDGLPAVDVFERMGLAENNSFVEGVEFLPFILSPNDQSRGCRFARGVVDFTENGGAVCRGTMYENAGLEIGSNFFEDILTGAEMTAKRINELPDVQAVLAYSCAVRRIALLGDPGAELDMIRNTINSDFPFMACYSGGEICPECADESEVQNSFHNFSLIVCVL